MLHPLVRFVFLAQKRPLCPHTTFRANLNDKFLPFWWELSVRSNNVWQQWLVTIYCCGPNVNFTKLCPFGDTQTVTEILQRAFDTLMHLLPCVSRRVGANLGFRVSDFLQLAQPTEDAHQLLLLYTMEKWRLGGAGFVCSWLLRGAPWRKVTKLSSPCHLSSLSQSLSLTRGAGGKEKKVTMTDRTEREGRTISQSEIENEN